MTTKDPNNQTDWTVPNRPDPRREKMTAKGPNDLIDWTLATWDGARRAKLRRWSRLPLERVITALEEMQEMSETLAKAPADGENKL